MPFPSRSWRLHVLVVAVLVVAVGCAHQPEPSAHLPPEDLALSGQIAGFLLGLFHGLTIVFNIIASLFFDIRIYAFPNSGRLYDLGYAIGAAALFGGSRGAARRHGANAEDDEDWCMEDVRQRRSRLRESERMPGDSGARPSFPS